MASLRNRCPRGLGGLSISIPTADTQAGRQAQAGPEGQGGVEARAAGQEARPAQGAAGQGTAQGAGRQEAGAAQESAAAEEGLSPGSVLQALAHAIAVISAGAALFWDSTASRTSGQAGRVAKPLELG